MDAAPASSVKEADMDASGSASAAAAAPEASSATQSAGTVEDSRSPHPENGQDETGERRESSAGGLSVAESALDGAPPDPAVLSLETRGVAEDGVLKDQHPDTARVESDLEVACGEGRTVESSPFGEESAKKHDGGRVAENLEAADSTSESSIPPDVAKVTCNEPRDPGESEEISPMRDLRETSSRDEESARDMGCDELAEACKMDEKISGQQDAIEPACGNKARKGSPSSEEQDKRETISTEVLEPEAPSGANTSEVEEITDLYDYNAALVSSIVDLKSIKWALERALKAARPEKGSSVRPQWDQLPRIVAMLREMMLVLQALYNSNTRANRGVATTILRNLIYDFQFAEVLLMLLKEYRPFRNGVAYLADLAEVTHTVIRLIKSFSEEAGGGLQRLRRRRRRRGRRRVEGEEGDGEWIDDGDDELEDEQVDEVAFTFDALVLKFAIPQVVSAYVYLLSHYRTNTPSTNHQVVKMHLCSMPFQVSRQLTEPLLGCCRPSRCWTQLHASVRCFRCYSS